ncbi:uncharacterized protein LOC143461099 [Clavelina lepadiformis]|uniref:Uncharacterized protein n=1 Tax=Clavelina lepadiformis TaxID=159417 RepID=A0ABP0FPT3_CLALP
MEKRRRESSPLLSEGSQSLQRYRTSGVHFDNAAYEGGSIYQDDDDATYAGNEPVALMEKKNHGKSIMILDAVLFVVEYLQMFALLQSLSLRWTWPFTWVNAFSFLFIFNLDAWELSKLASGSYIEARDRYVPSADIPINYMAMLLCWLIALLAFGFAYFSTHWVFTHHLKTRALTILTAVFIISAQVLALPIGVQIGKLFWCRPTDNVLDVDNGLICWSLEHCVYIVLAVLVAAVVFIVYPVWLARKVNQEVITKNMRKHEAYLKLKHCEQIYQLDSSWSERSFFTFASFRRFWVFHRPANHLIKFLIVCLYAALFNARLVQICLILAIFTLQILVCLVQFSYRVTSFNFPHLWSLLCLWSCAVIGTMKNIPGIQSVFLLPSYVQGELILINAGWLIGMLLWFSYFLARLLGVFYPNRPLWPSLLDHGKEKLNVNTERYMVACINGRKAIKKANSVPALLAPVQELAHHIKVLNALACEAEFIRDPLQSSLRDTLDDVIQLHNTLTPVSIFTESLKTYVQTTINKLIEVLPAFSKRLQQREFDMILARPVRRRMLLKMFAISCFVRAGREERPHEHGVRKLWSAPALPDGVFDEGFHEDESVIALDNIEITARQGRFTPSGNRAAVGREVGTASFVTTQDESFA